MKSFVANPSAIILLLGLFFVLIFIGVPISISVLLSSCVTCWYIGIPLQTMAMQVLKGLNVYTLMAVPMFILMGEIMSRGGITNRLIALSNALVGWIRGSLAQINIVTCLFFGCISGSSAAATASIGSMMIPRMEEEGYDTDFATCVSMASSVEAMLIPPSHNMILFALAAGGVSVGRVFMGGIVPGVVLAIVLGIYCYFISIKRNYPKGDKFNLRRAITATFKALPGLSAVLFVVVGVLAGYFTATEAAAAAVVWSLIVGMFFYREIKLCDIPQITRSALKTTCMIMFLIGSSSCFSWLVSYLDVASLFTNWLTSITDSRIVILLLINIFLIICGMVMDMSAIILIVTPILLPITQNIGMDAAQFCAMMILNLGIGVITPPVGNTLFIGSALSGRNIIQLSKAMLPFYLVMFVSLLAVTFIPQISTFLPDLLMA